ncbi:hypothetical protein V7094_27865 [Priestia megaterium]|uniref:hypothetical protein n=1 Tax=Priestia megaterium TaxID=1404 RepID=UPI002FFD5DE3
MELKGKFKVVNVIKKSSAVFFKELKVGDEFELRYNLNGGYGQTADIDIYQGGKEVHWNDASRLRRNLKNFEVEQIA